VPQPNETHVNGFLFTPVKSIDKKQSRSRDEMVGEAAKAFAGFDTSTTMAN
jgi:hypothetical protein